MSRIKLATLTMDNTEGFVIDDELAYPFLTAFGIEVYPVSWKRVGIDWKEFDMVLIRTPWDYHHAPEAFVSVLEQIEASGTLLHNTLSFVRWNISKTYLRDLAHVGVNVVPTLWIDACSELAWEAWCEALESEELVIKPVISANADHTYRIHSSNLVQMKPYVQRVLHTHSCMVQPFLSTVLEEGEYSVLYFNGVLSHALLKTPRRGDFRVQEEHGGVLQEVHESVLHEIGVASAAHYVMEKLGYLHSGTPLYARVDLVRYSGGAADTEFALMELELIEPSLYLRMNKGAPERFAQAVYARIYERCR
ncbi:MAG: hypothetical protein RML40_07345 [Bacteroidota bacterium]|nr:hypothetical protein [Candidatus Kapabacteria bacterium]MDW8220332.1 hypothetical protein [Bacteroidota bacterium]